MKIVRQGVFETNSSSTHSLSICSTEDFIKWKNGELFYCCDEDKFYTLEERNKMLLENNIDPEDLEHSDNYNDELYSYPITYDEFCDNICYGFEYFEEDAIIKGFGITIFGYCGYLS